MKNRKGKKRKKTVRNPSRTLTAGWGTFFALAAAFVVVIWFVISPFVSEEAHVLAKLAIVLGIAAVCSAFATYVLNSALAKWSRWKRRRS